MDHHPHHRPWSQPEPQVLELTILPAWEVEEEVVSVSTWAWVEVEEVQQVEKAQKVEDSPI